MASKGTALPTVSAASKSAVSSQTTAPKTTKNDNKATEKSKTSAAAATNANSNLKTSSAIPVITSPDSSAGKVSGSKIEKLPSIGSGNKTSTIKSGNNASKSKGLTELPASPVTAVNSSDGSSVSNSSVVNSKESTVEPLIDIVPAVSTGAAGIKTEDNKTAEPIVVVAKEEPIIPAAPVVNNNNGKVKLIYEQYDEEFPIQAGSTTQENIDDVYCLSFVMPNCRIHLSVHAPAAKRTIQSNAIDAAQKGDDKGAYALYQSLYLEEVPLGTYQGLEDDKTYYVYVEQEAEQLARDQEATRLRLKVEKTDPKITRDDGRAMESCSCIYGNPCVDEYGCKDWDNRNAVAMKNGWKGF